MTGLFRMGRHIAIPYRRRSAWLWAVAFGVVVILMLVTLMAGELGITPRALSAYLNGSASKNVTFVLEKVRGPRVLTAALAGAAFGLAGALFQNVTRNPLGSPDVIGLSSGAGAGVALTSLYATGLPTPVGALAGAFLAIAAVGLATGSGYSDVSRLIIAGIAVAAMGTAITQFVVSATLRDQAARLAGYLVGSLNARNFTHVAIVAGALVASAPILLLLASRLTMMEFGDELATSMGAPARPTRNIAIVLSAFLAAMGVCAVGPIAFVSLMSPHAARMLSRTPGPQLTGSALVGAVLLLLADLAVQQIPLLSGLPTGVVTAGFGGLFLGYLLVNEFKKGTA